jgi:hypothetical protein
MMADSWDLRRDSRCLQDQSRRCADDPRVVAAVRAMLFEDFRWAAFVCLSRLPNTCSSRALPKRWV